MRLFFLLISGLIVAVASKGTPTCETDNDCNLNGECLPGVKTCKCDSGWTSSDCGALDLRPATRGTGFNITSTGTSTWGSKIIHDPHNPKLFHLFLAEFTDDCGLDYWSPYSRIIRAESTAGPAGPYTFTQEVVGAFAHNPTVIYSPADRKYLLYYIGCPQSPPETCTDPSFTCGPGNFINGESGISLQSSTDLKTWKFVGQIFQGANDDAWDADVTNPSPFPLWSHSDQTSEILLAYRGCPVNCSGNELLNLATARSFGGPYTKTQSLPLFSAPNEDPFIWRDKRGHFHMLTHSLEPDGSFGSGPKVGRHAYSRTLEGPWTFNNQTLAFSTLVEYSDGTSVNFYRRERPQLFFSEDGQMTPLYLSNGVQENGSSMSYSVIQPLAGAKQWEKTFGLAA
ncbi:hypothetical protein D0Z07_5974 [Hyphodiscus hymeniophilus]|uniref:EGF-like domain-containing protein n=1 Tax=Hyphodiscus hymeniophilus TaxID=353542 RepID=A0A9P7AVU3_9HELO|nr:hypothetical protein D0Z07_5974 [Hyphodiscus hymeniophilus]